MPEISTDTEDLGNFWFEGTRPAVAQLAAVLRDAATTPETVIALRNGQVRVLVNSDPRFSASRQDVASLDLQGDANAILWFAGELQTFADREDFGGHMHMEYVPGHLYWTPDSHPLIIRDNSGD